ncbi:hypothetical protein SEA_ECLIPTUS_52 [Gordonia phage Ecliptus]|nr:hypothetical protein SEA_ECLIPTUS_52 [Gordonia phage Ecliptus]
MTATAAKLAEFDAVQDVRLNVLESSFVRRTSNELAEDRGTIEVQGRIDISRGDGVTLGILIVLEHETPTVSGKLSASVQYDWLDAETDESALLEFARQYGVPTALPAATALLTSEFLRLGVRTTFLPPLMAERVAEILVDGYQAPKAAD